MEIQTKKQPKNLIEITVELSAQEIKPFNDQALKELSKDVKVSGFRPGKAPEELIRRQIGDIKTLEQAAELAINAKYPEIVEQEKLIPAGPPQVSIQKLAPNNPFVFKLTVPLIPKVKLGDYQKIKVEKKELSVKPEQIDKTIKELQSFKGQEILVNRGSKQGDKVQIDLNLFVDKVPLEDGQIKDLSFIVGQDQYLPGLSDNLKGLKKDQEKEFSFQYPMDHYDKKLAGRKVDFKAKIKNVYQINLPEIDDRFAQSVGPFKTVQELKEKINQNLAQEQKNKEEQRLEIEILKQLINQTEFEDIPEVLIEHELDKMVNELKTAIERPDDPTSPKFDDYLQSIKKTEQDLRKDFISKAEERIKTALAIREIALKEKIEAGGEEIKKEMDNISTVYKNQKEVLENLKSDSGQTYLKNLLINRKVVEWLKKQAL